MTRPRLAIIGTGIAGLGCAHFLQRDFDLTIFEQNDYVGGHTNTVDIPENGRALPVDTGFMVFNHVTYPLLTRLFREMRLLSTLITLGSLLVGAALGSVLAFSTTRPIRQVTAAILGADVRIVAFGSSTSLTARSDASTRDRSSLSAT